MLWDENTSTLTSINIEICQQDQWQSSFFLRHAVYGRNLQEAIDTPSFHSEHFVSSFYPRGAKPGRLVVEGRTPEATVDGLRDRGH